MVLYGFSCSGRWIGMECHRFYISMGFGELKSSFHFWWIDSNKRLFEIYFVEFGCGYNPNYPKIFFYVFWMVCSLMEPFLGRSTNQASRSATSVLSKARDELATLMIRV
jgi:hypothetical protein